MTPDNTIGANGKILSDSEIEEGIRPLIEEQREQWISIKDRLPKGGQRCLLWHSTQLSYAVGFYNASFQCFEVDTTCLYADDNVITFINKDDLLHWAPLLPPPKTTTP